MDSIRKFLAHAVRLEAEAARRFDELAEHMATHGNAAVESVFRQFADFSRLHLQTAMSRAGFRYIEDLPRDGYEWPHGESPEAAPWWGVDGLMDVEAALRLALESEQGGLDFYRSVALGSADPRVQAMAQEFAAEEAEHVARLQELLAEASGRT
ncbi:ferritin family protein [Pseudothauera rhizosphaerae]|uniref:Rubrerythrin n=1 Tax=Pseudothauera rhizosphaerae TaxID=2565932 RepID=A0A4S4ATK8_9RHOO|nr:rubrerythrin [Pseudothauera rhizosphaerae]THF63231.1 rubrerythrin [Pseudothauera rhizosphaerae]